MLKKQRMRSQKGFTLVELIISVALGIAAVSAIMFFYISTLSSSYTTLKSSKLNQELSTAIAIVVQDIKRAGFVGGTIDPKLNPFNEFGETSLRLFDSNASTKPVALADINSASFTTANWFSDCVLFSYDLDKDQILDADEYFGYRMTSDGDFQIHLYNGVPPVNSCANNANWQSLIDKDEIIVTNFVVSLEDSNCINVEASKSSAAYNCYIIEPSIGDTTVEELVVEITLDGKLVGDDVSLSLNQRAKIRNPIVRIR